MPTTIQAYASNDNRYYSTLTLTELSADETGWTIDYVLTVTKTGGSGYFNYTDPQSVSIVADGNTIYSNNQFIYDFRGSTPKTITIANGSFFIANNGSSQRTINVLSSVALDELGVCSGSGTFTTSEVNLNPTIDGFTLQKVGKEITATIGNRLDGYIYVLKWATANYSGQFDDVFVGTIPLSVMNDSPSSSSISITFTCEKYRAGSGLQGSTTKTYTFSADEDDIAPEVLSIVSVTPATIKQYVTSATLLFSISSLTGKYGASVDTYEVYVNGSLQTSGNAVVGNVTVVIPPFDREGANFITVKAVDSRNIAQTVTQSVTVEPNMESEQVGFGGTKYRLFFKSPFALSGDAIWGSQTQVLSLTINEDTQKKATSTFTIVEIPNAVEIGDFVGLYDELTSKVLYQGIVTDLDYDGQVVTAQQLLTLWDVYVAWTISAQTTLEGCLAVPFLMMSFFGINTKSKYDDVFKSFEAAMSGWSVTSTPIANYTLPDYSNENKTLYSQMIEFFNSYNITVLTNLLPYADKSTITTPLTDSNKYLRFINTTTGYTKKTISDNTHCLRNFTVVKNKSDVNCIEVRDATTKARPSGITEGHNIFVIKNDNTIASLYTGTDIPHQIKNKIIYVDPDNYDLTDEDVLHDIAYENMNVEMYNHEIEVDLDLDNSLFDFWNDFHLGQLIDVYIADKKYETMLTGYKITNKTDGVIKSVHLILGKARQDLSFNVQKLESQVSETYAIATSNIIPSSIGRTLLWTNSGNSLNAETVSLDLSGYSHIIVGGFAWQTTGYTEAICPVGNSSVLSYIAYNTDSTSSVINFMNWAMRTFSVSTSGVSFDNGQMAYTGNLYRNWNSRAVPKYIWGVNI